MASLLMAVHGFYLLRQIGRPDRSLDNPTRLGLEKTTRLVTAGAYGFIRHPLRASLLRFGWGAWLKQPTWPSSLLAVVVTAAVYLTARGEEGENLEHLGPEYAEYIQRTQMFIPFVF